MKRLRASCPSRFRLVAFAVGMVLPAVAVMPAAGDTFRFASGPLMLDFDDVTGALLKLSHTRHELVRGEAGQTPVTFGVGPAADKTAWVESFEPSRRLVSHRQPATNRLELTVRAGEFEWIERYDILDDGARLDRSVRLVSRADDERRLRGFAFILHGVRVPVGAGYGFPAKWPPERHVFDGTQEGVRHWGHGTLASAVAEGPNGLTLAWASFADDPPSIEIREGRDSLTVRQNLAACGRLEPGVTQDVGYVSMVFADGNYREGMRRLQSWMGEAGLRLPSDHTAWLGASVLYSFHPGGTIGSGWRDLGGFGAAGRLVPPRMHRLGANAAWILPIEFKSPYWPLDYYRFMDGLGTTNEYRSLIAKLHGEHFRVIQDLVPHGGAPYAVHNKAHPEFMLRREDGSTLDYWLNDFARPDWQAYIAGVARHYAATYGIDGYRVDACFGSKEPNWSPDIPYARASLAKLHGGLGMMHAIRTALKDVRPDGALLAEVESERHYPYSDATYDFTFGLRVCRDLREREPAEFVRMLRTFLDEQRFVVPKGAPRLRFIESHDTTRAQGWYGVQGMRALYALSAWIDGMPMIYQGGDIGHGPAFAEIDRIRNEHPELQSGDADYVGIQCEPPEVFAASRFKDGKATTFAINFGREPALAVLTEAMTGAAIELRPMEYAIVQRGRSAAASPVELGGVTNLPATLCFEGATEWFVDTAEGRLHDWYDGPSAAVPARGGSSSIYWRPQGRGDLWQNELTPLHPLYGRIGVRSRDGVWRGFAFGASGATNAMRLCDQHDGRAVLTLLGTQGTSARTWRAGLPPLERDVTAAVDMGGVGFRVVGPDYIVTNRHYSVLLRRTGGVIRELRAADGTRLASGQTLYADQEAFAVAHEKRIGAENEGETGIRVWRATDGLHLAFEGHLRGGYRFALKRPALVFRNEYVFTSGPAFTHRWSYCTEKVLGEKKAFLSFFVRDAGGDSFRFLRGDREVSRGTIAADGEGRVGVAKGESLPDTLVFAHDGKPLWSLRGLRMPDGPAGGGCSAFMLSRMLFLTFLDGRGDAMEAGREYRSSCEWRVETAVH